MAQEPTQISQITQIQWPTQISPISKIFFGFLLFKRIGEIGEICVGLLVSAKSA